MNTSRGAEMKNRLVPHQCVQWLRNQEKYLCCRVVHKKQSFPDPDQAPQSTATGLRRKVPKTLVVKISGDSIQVRWRAAEVPVILLNGLHKDPLAHKHSPLASEKRQQLEKSEKLKERN